MAQAEQRRRSGKGVAEQASETLDDAASKAQETAVQLKEQGSERVRSQLDQRSTQAGEQMRSLAAALRRSEAQLAQEGGSGTQLTGQVAERVDRLGAYLQQTTSDDLIRDVERFARRRPWMLAGLGTLAGLAAARFVKASSEQRYGPYRQSLGARYGSPAAAGAAGAGLRPSLPAGPEIWEEPATAHPSGSDEGLRHQPRRLTGTR
jgi:ElaB/YqjD/DUF883 family membrane-anchored ribosome-binding protein